MKRLLARIAVVAVTLTLVGAVLAYAVLRQSLPQLDGEIALTDIGVRTRNILFELALLGGQFPLEGEAVEPGNVRTIAVTLGTACHRAITTTAFGMYLKLEASIVVDGEAYTLSVRDRTADMVQKKSESPDLVVETSYESMLALGEGEITLQDFVDSHAQMEVLTPGKEREFQELMAAALAQLQG